MSSLRLSLLLGCLALSSLPAWSRPLVTDFLLRGGEVTLQLSEPAKFAWQRERLPDRLVVDIDDCEIAGLTRQLIRSASFWYDRVRVEKRQDALHLVFYLRPDAHPEVLAESPSDSLVISPGRGRSAADAQDGYGSRVPAREPLPRDPESEVPRAQPLDPSLGSKAAIERISIEPPRDGTVDVVVELSRAIRPVSFPLFTDPAKPRIVVDFPGAVIRPAEQRIDASVRDLVTHVHTGMFEGKTPRIVLNLTQKTGYQQIVLDTPFRVILRVGGQGIPVPEVPSVAPRPPAAEPEEPAVQVQTGPLRGSLIVVDAGHGGHDPGARGFGLKEKDITLDIARRLTLLLQNAGARAVMTRTDDRYISVKGRPMMANSLGADLFVSIHCNSTGGPRKWSGSETYYHFSSRVQKQFARVMQRQLVARLGLPDRGVRSDGVRFPGAGFGVLRHARMPAVLVEVGYVNHPADAAKLGDAGARQQAAEGIFRGIKAFREGGFAGDAAPDIPSGIEDGPGALEETE